MRRAALVGVALAAGVVALAFAFASREEAASAVPMSGPMPPLEDGSWLGGGAVRSADLEGPVVVLNFWASWCAPCREEQPALERLWREYRDRGVRFVGVSSMDLESDALAFVEEFGVTYSSLFDPSGDVMRRFEVAYLPATVLVRNGELHARLPGARSEEELRLRIEALLADP